MASKNYKRMAAVATLAASVVLMGGAAFAAPTPDPVNKAATTARNTEVNAVNQIKAAFATPTPDRASQASTTARNTEVDAVNQIKAAF